MQEVLTKPGRLLAPVVALALLAPATAGADFREAVQVSRGPVGGNAEVTSAWGGVTPDGSRVWFSSLETMVGAHDGGGALYERTGGQTSVVSQAEPGATGTEKQAGFLATTADGSHVVFATNEALVPADDDTHTDLYERTGGHTYLVTVREQDTLLSLSPVFVGMSADGSKIFFNTNEPLDADDQDEYTDLYERSGGDTKLLSTGPDGGNGNQDAVASTLPHAAVTPDGATACFVTRESLISTDVDSVHDVYCRTGATLVLATPDSGAVPQDVLMEHVSADGSRIAFTTAEQVLLADTDDKRDLYEGAGGQTTQLSPGNGPHDVSFQAAGDDGLRVYFTTKEPLVGQDLDALDDVYQRTGGATTIESQGPTGGNGTFDDLVFSGINPDGSRVYFETREPLVNDGDFSYDIFESHAGVIRRVSVAAINDSGPYRASFGGASPDGSRVLFQTDGPFTTDDTDDRKDDMFEWDGQTTLLATPGTEDADAVFKGRSADASLLWFTSPERLDPFDTDLAVDVFESRRVDTPDPPPDAVPGPGAGDSPPGSEPAPSTSASPAAPKAPAARVLAARLSSRCLRAPLRRLKLALRVSPQGSVRFVLERKANEKPRKSCPRKPGTGGKGWRRMRTVSRTMRAGNTSLRVDSLFGARRLARGHYRIRAGGRVLAFYVR